MTGRTILFADQVGSTHQLAEIGDEAALTVRRTLQRLLIETIETYNGRMFSDDGDGCAAVFARAEDAARAALRMLDGAAQSRAEVAEQLAIHLRIGIHSGNVIPNGPGFVGMAVHLGARMCEEAPPDFIVASDDAVANLTNCGDLRVTPFGRRVMKGIAKPIDVNLLSDASAPIPPVAELQSSSEPELTIRSASWLEERPLPKTFIDRPAELARLDEVYVASAQQVQVVFVGGEPGVGKSTLIHSYAREKAATERTICLVGRCDENTDRPYREFVEALHHLVAEAPTQMLAEHVLRHGSLLTRLIPGLAHRVPTASLSELAEDIDRYRLHEAVADLLRSAARLQPVLLVIEDIQWASEPSLDLMAHLAKSAGLASVIVVGTYRPTELGSGKRTLPFVTRLAREPNVQRLELARFSAGQARQLVAAALARAGADQTVAADLSRHLYRQTAGSPLFLTQMLKSLEESDELRSIGDPGSIEAVRVPETVQELATTRVDRLGEDHAALLADAALLGSTFRLPELEHLAEDLGLDVLEILEAAEQAGIVSEEPSSPDGAFVFRHALIQNALYDRIGPTRRRRRHRAAADAVVAVAGPGLKGHAADALSHLERCGSLARPGEIVTLAGLAADEAADRLALVEAVRYRQRAADAVVQDPSIDPALLAEVLFALGSSQTAAGHAEGRPSMVAAAQAARACGRWDLFASAAVGYGGVLKENQASPVDVGIALVDEALSHYREPSELRARLLVAGAVWKRQHVPYVERRALVDEALSIARQIGDSRTLAAVLSEYHRALHGPNAMPEALEMADELEGLAAQLADDSIAFQALNLRLIATAELGMWELAQHTADQLDQVAERLRNIEGRRISLSWKVVTANLRGQFETASTRVAELKELLKSYPAEDFGRMFGALEFIPLWLKGHSELLYQLTANPDFAVSTTRVWFAADAGRPLEARELLSALPPVSSVTLHSDYLWWNDVVSLTRVALRLGDGALAKDVYEILEPFCEGHAAWGVVAFAGCGRHHLGSLCFVLGRFDEAISNYEAAVSRYEAMEARPFIALSKAELAAAFDARGGPGDSERALVLRSEALDTATELSLELVIETAVSPDKVMRIAV